MDIYIAGKTYPVELISADRYRIDNLVVRRYTIQSDAADESRYHIDVFNKGSLQYRFHMAETYFSLIRMNFSCFDPAEDDFECTRVAAATAYTTWIHSTIKMLLIKGVIVER